MTAAEIVREFERMLGQRWTYAWGSAAEGVVDCAGAFVWAYRQHGKHIYHGSNRIARTEVVQLLPPDKWEPGMAAFKAKKPGEGGYALPQGYRPGGGQYNGDTLDYYHIGLIDEGGEVLNAQSAETGFVRSKLEDGWDYVARLKKVIYPTREEGKGVATVKTPDGNPAKMRRDPSTKNPYIDKVPSGTEVEVLETATSDGEMWSKIRAGGVIGYMMSKYLEDAEGKAEEKTQANAEADGNKAPETRAETLREMLEELKTIRALLQGGNG
jgi:hypothetical protein